MRPGYLVEGSGWVLVRSYLTSFQRVLRYGGLKLPRCHKVHVSTMTLRHSKIVIDTQRIICVGNCNPPNDPCTKPLPPLDDNHGSRVLRQAEGPWPEWLTRRAWIAQRFVAIIHWLVYVPISKKEQTYSQTLQPDEPLWPLAMHILLISAL